MGCVSKYLSEDRVHAWEVEMFVTFQKGKILLFCTIADIPKRNGHAAATKFAKNYRV